jgi:hypothetical protein
VCPIRCTSGAGVPTRGTGRLPLGAGGTHFESNGPGPGPGPGLLAPSADAAPCCLFELRGPHGGGARAVFNLF